MKTKLLMISLLAGSIWFASCTKYPSDVTRTQEELAILTKYDTKKDFNQYKTFLVPEDGIYSYDGGDSGYVNNDRTASLIATVVKNMTDRGYTQVFKPTKPDLGISLTYIKNVNVDVYYPYYPYWGYWGYYPYYGYGYSYPYVTSYSVGTFFVDILDVKNASGEQLNAIFSGVIRGLYTNTHTSTDITNSINQMFNQSMCFQVIN